MNSNYRMGEKLLNQFDEDGIKTIIDNLSDVSPHIGRYIIESYGQYFSNPILDYKQREMITISALTSLGDCSPQLKWHINFSLNLGMTPNEIIEIITHCIPFSGFPRALNAVNHAKQIFIDRNLEVEIGDELKNETGKLEKGMVKLEEIEGEHGLAVLQSLENLAPQLGEKIIRFTFGEIYRRNGINLKQRQLVTLGALTAQGGCEPQLNVHINTAINVAYHTMKSLKHSFNVRFMLVFLKY